MEKSMEFFASIGVLLIIFYIIKILSSNDFFNNKHPGIGVLIFIVAGVLIMYLAFHNHM
jgi:hypothetical protein